jgi:hypothetical protein
MTRDQHMWGQRQEPPPADEVPAWITGAVPDDWFVEAPSVVIDRDEITIVGRLADPTMGEESTAADLAAAEAGRISSFREATRDRRIQIAQQLEHRYRRKVAWGATCGHREEIFTSLAAPAMTRLRQSERQVLDTLVDAGVARSRSEALAWCVRLVGEHADDWLSQLRDALGTVETLRRQGPAL